MLAGTQQASWLLAWLDQESLTDATQVRSAFGDQRRLTRLRSAMAASPFSPPVSRATSLQPIAAGTSFDLAGGLGTCHHSACLIRDVERFLQRTWHYFDEVLVAGPSAYQLARLFDTDRDQALERTLAYAEVLFHIRRIGAEPYITFGEKRPPCTQHQAEHARDAGMTDLLTETPPEWVTSFAQDATIDVRPASWSDECGAFHWSYAVAHPDLMHTVWGDVHAPATTAVDEVRYDALADVHQRHVAYLIADVNFARMTDAPLGTAGLHEQLLGDRATTSSPSEHDVAFDLPLPYVDDIPASTLLKLREDDRDSFDRFRHALRTAIRERIGAGMTEPRDATDVAIEICRDVIDPALREISSTFTKASATLRRAGGLSFGVGLAATTVGLLASTPLVIGPLVGAAVAASDAKNYLASRADVRDADMYFLWRMIEKHGR